jgi:hypothetical protein
VYYHRISVSGALTIPDRDFAPGRPSPSTLGQRPAGLAAGGRATAMPREAGARQRCAGGCVSDVAASPQTRRSGSARWVKTPGPWRGTARPNIEPPRFFLYFTRRKQTIWAAARSQVWVRCPACAQCAYASLAGRAAPAWLCTRRPSAATALGRCGQEATAGGARPGVHAARGLAAQDGVLRTARERARARKSQQGRARCDAAPRHALPGRPQPA